MTSSLRAAVVGDDTAMQFFSRPATVSSLAPHCSRFACRCSSITTPFPLHLSSCLEYSGETFFSCSPGIFSRTVAQAFPFKPADEYTITTAAMHREKHTRILFATTRPFPVAPLICFQFTRDFVKTTYTQETRLRFYSTAPAQLCRNIITCAPTRADEYTVPVSSPSTVRGTATHEVQDTQPCQGYP